jgi:hypothetical protein
LLKSKGLYYAMWRQQVGEGGDQQLSEFGEVPALGH